MDYKSWGDCLISIIWCGAYTFSQANYRLDDNCMLCPNWDTIMPDGIEAESMSKSAMVRARIEPELKEHAERIFRELGLSVTQAITLFYRQVEMQNGLPFNVVIPTSETLETFEATDSGQDVIVCEDGNDMFKKLGI
jgi:DNA-damage-inducible protein J